MNPVIPDTAMNQHLAILGKTGSGKTYAAKGAVEQLLGAGRRVCIIDPTGAWWGLRSSADGKGPGFPILVLGGDHGDLPLPVLGGGAVARLVSEQGVSLIADTSSLTVGERTRWFIDFATTLFRSNRTPMHLVIDEAHMFAPQGKVPDPDTGKMLHAANTIASGGRSRGIRVAGMSEALLWLLMDHVKADPQNGPTMAPVAKPKPTPAPKATAPTPAPDGLSRPQLAILRSIATWNAAGVEHPSRRQVAWTAPASHRSSGFENGTPTRLDHVHSVRFGLSVDLWKRRGKLDERTSAPCVPWVSSTTPRRGWSDCRSCSLSSLERGKRRR